MTTASEIIRLAFREGNFIAIGASPSDDENSEGLILLQNIMDTLFPLTVGTSPQPWYVPNPQQNSNRSANYPALPGDPGLPQVHDVDYPPPNVRLMMRNTSARTIYFQYQPQDGAIMEFADTGFTADITLNGNGALFGLAGTSQTVSITPDPTGARRPPRKWVYRGDYGAWVEITALELTDELPFPTAFDDFFVTELAIRLTPRDGLEPRQITLLRNRDMKTYIRTLYTQMAEVWFKQPGLRPEQSWQNYPIGADFNTGR